MTRTFKKEDICGDACKCWLDKCDVCGGTVCLDINPELRPATLQVSYQEIPEAPRVPCTSCKVPQQISDIRSQMGYHFTCPDCGEETFSPQEPNRIDRDEERDITFICHGGGGERYVFCSSCNAEFNIFVEFEGIDEEGRFTQEFPKLFHRLVRPENEHAD
jgi:predicted RNA-binding Zn-ribbon protein involved in translation (DUF1610 family)